MIFMRFSQKYRAAVLEIFKKDKLVFHEFIQCLCETSRPYETAIKKCLLFCSSKVLIEITSAFYP